MSIQFENRYYITDKMLFEYVYKVIFKKIIVMSFIFFTMCLVSCLILLFLNASQLEPLFYCGGGVLLFNVLLPIVVFRQIKANNTSIHNGKEVETVTKFGDNISITAGSVVLTIEYSQIKNVYSLKHSYVLMFGKGLGIVLSPKHFTVGTFEEFKSFIKSKILEEKQLKL